jgi:DnaJ family protein C protein 13
MEGLKKKKNSNKIGNDKYLSRLRENIGMRVVKSLRRNDEAVAQLALELVCALMVPLHQTWDLRQEQLNKASLLSSPKFLASLLDMWAGHVVYIN